MVDMTSNGPDGPCFLVRALAALPAAAGPGVPLELAHKDAHVVGDTCFVCDLPDFEWHAFDPDAADPPRGLPRCTQAVLSATVWDTPPGALLTHDVSRAREAFGPDLTAELPWIDTRRVAGWLWPEAPSLGLEALAAWRRLHAVASYPYVCPGPQPRAVREVALTLLLLADQLAQLGELAELLRLSAVPARPRGEPPALRKHWRTRSTDDLWWWSCNAADGSPEQGGAWAELRRRRRAGQCLPCPELHVPAQRPLRLPR